MALDPPATDLAPANPLVTTSPGLHVDGVTAGYWRGHPVLESFSMQIEGRGCYHLSAPNGAGKSTLFEVLAGYLEPSAGTVTVAGERVVAGRRVTTLRVQRSVPALVPGITLRDHLHLYARRYGRSADELADLACRLGLGEHLEKVPEALSTGSLKKAWFVCHAAGDEAVWCLDEPFNGVDKESAGVMATYLAHQSRQRQIVLTAHLLPAGVEAVGSPLPADDPFVVRALLLG